MKTCLWALLYTLTVTSSALALPVPEPIRSFILDHHRDDLLRRFDTIPMLAPHTFSLQVLSEPQTAIGAGFNGFVLKNAENVGTKLTYPIIHDLGLIRPKQLHLPNADLIFRDWSIFRNSALVRSLDFTKLREANYPVETSTAKDEVFGMLMCALFNSSFELFPNMISSDGLAYRRDFIEGPTLSQVLKSQRNNGTLHLAYDMDSIWEQVVGMQKDGERMLLETGVVMDLLNPNNLILIGKAKSVRLKPIDASLIRPSEEALTYYSSLGLQIPSSERFASILKLTTWPTPSEQIVFNTAWALNFEQAVTYMMFYHSTKSRIEAIRFLSEVPQWKIEIDPTAADYSNIQKAKKYFADNGQNSSCKISLSTEINLSK